MQPSKERKAGSLCVKLVEPNLRPSGAGGSRQEGGPALVRALKDGKP